MPYFPHSVAALGYLQLNRRSPFNFSLAFSSFPPPLCVAFYLRGQGLVPLPQGTPKAGRAREKRGESRNYLTGWWYNPCYKVHINYKNSYSNLRNLSFLLNQLIKEHHSFPSLRVRRV